jgi:arylsulfatase A-like enzyme
MILIALLIYLVFLNSAFNSSYGENQQTSLPNLLFLMSDDLRTDLSIYNRKHIISPNFERLAKRSIIFDKAYNQLAVCFPSRHSMLTGIRPDTTGIHTWTDGQLPFLDSLFSILVRNNYHSAGIGKLFHHPHNGSNEFPDGRWDGYWYKYQAYEQVFMNSSITPDDNFPEEDFRDYIIASYGIDKIKELVKKSQVTKNPFSISIGFKQPHTQYHIPRKYFELYKNNTYLSNILINAKNDPKYGFPVTTPRMNYRCCDRFKFWPMVDEGRKKSTKILPKFEKFYGSMRFPPQAIMELQWGYFGGITFLDAMVYI